MKSNYKPLSKYIQAVNDRNTDGRTDRLLGIKIDKYFMPSVANVVGTDLSVYKIVKKGQFACNRMHVGRDKRLPVALSKAEDDFIVSPAYDVFEIIDEDLLKPDYLMMWFSRKEFDRNAWFYTDADVRGGLSWSAFYNMQLPVPSIEKQKEIVEEYNIIVNRIKLNEQLNQKLEETAQAIYKQWFVDFEFPDESGKPYKSSGGKMVWNEELEREIPEGWEGSKILEFFELQRGFDLPIQKRVAGQVPIFAANGLSDFHNEAKVNGPAVITGRSGTIGNVFFVLEDCWPLNTTLWVKNFNVATPLFAYFILKNTELKGFHSGSAVPTLNRNDIHVLYSPKPPRELINKFENIQNKIFNFINKNVKQINHLILFNDILLSKMTKAGA